MSALIFVCLLAASGAQQGFGTPRIAKFLGGRPGAVSLQFDDSMTSQVANAVPLLNKRGLKATFFVNPERQIYKDHIKEWEGEIPKAGHELANHTLHHNGANNAEEADREITQCSDVLHRVLGKKPRLMTFGQPGGVPWNVTPEQLAPIFRRLLLIPAVDRTFFDEAQADPITLVAAAETESKWVQLGMHGTGGEWLNTSVPTLTKILDYLVDHKSTIWCAPTIDVVKYMRERDAARPLRLSQVSDNGFSVEVSCDPTKLDTFGYKVSELYDQPLTVEVTVPVAWKRATVTSAKVVQQVAVTSGILRFEVMPDHGSVSVTKS